MRPPREPFSSLPRSSRAVVALVVVVAVILAVLVSAVVAGLLAWATIGVWGRVLA